MIFLLFIIFSFFSKYLCSFTRGQRNFEYEYEDFSDWYLPSRSELQEIYLSVGQGSEIGNIGGFIDSWYWSSTEDEIPEAAYCFSFIYGAVGGNHREGMINVRPIRSF